MITRSSAVQLFATTMATPTMAGAVVSTTITSLPTPFSAILVTASAAPSCTATVAIAENMQCFGPTGWTETTTVPYYFDCLGCPTATTSYMPECCCPLGGYPPWPPPLTNQTSTRFDFVCSPTPPASTAIQNPTDHVTTLPAPTFAPTGLAGLAYTPTAVQVRSFAQGWCEVQVDLAPNPCPPSTDDQANANASAYSSSYCAQSSGGARPSSWASTTTTTIGVDCGACATPWAVRWAGDPPCADRYGASSAGPVQAVSGATTTWAYACETALASASCTSASSGKWCVNGPRTSPT
jgi:hypothetical protein